MPFSPSIAADEESTPCLPECMLSNHKRVHTSVPSVATRRRQEKLRSEEEATVLRSVPARMAYDFTNLCVHGDGQSSHTPSLSVCKYISAFTATTKHFKISP